MGMKVTAVTARLRAKQKAMVAAARAELEPTAVTAMQMFVKEAAKWTPPASAHDGSIMAGVRRLKERIAVDLAGDGTEVPGDMRWITVHGKPKLVFKNKAIQARQPSPFILVKKVDDKVREAHHVGKYGVVVAEDPAAYLAGQPARFYVKRRHGKGAAHLRWSGARAIATTAAVKRAIRVRQKRAGTLMSGWNALAGEVHAQLPASIKRLRGRGSCEKSKQGPDKLAISGRNKADVHGVGLAPLLDKRRKKIDEAIRRKLKARNAILRRKLKSVA